MNESFILDACALIAYFKKEEGFELLFSYFDRANNEEISLFMHKLNLLEVFYGFYRDDGIETAEAVLNDAFLLPITFVDDLRDPFITSDHHDFEPLEQKEAIKFSWTR